MHFAVDNNLAYMTTKIDGMKTYFLPFNRGHNNGAGNSPVEGKFATCYLWEDVFTLNITEPAIRGPLITDGMQRGRVLAAYRNKALAFEIDREASRCYVTFNPDILLISALLPFIVALIKAFPTQAYSNIN